MKVLMINEVLGVTSTGVLCAELAEYLLSHGHEVKVLYGRLAATKRCEAYGIRIASDAEVRCNALAARLLDNCGLGNLASTERAVRFIREFAPDVIHLHNLHGYYVNYERLLWSIGEMRIPVIWTLHDCWALTGHCAYFDYCGCEKWQKECVHCPQSGAYPRSLFLDRSAYNYQKKKECYQALTDTKVVVPSQWLADIVRKSILDKDAYVIPNGIDTGIFTKKAGNYFKERGLTDKKVLLGVASIWEPRKGLPFFVDLAKRLPEEYQIVLVGIKEEQKKELPRNILTIARTNDQEELAAIYSGAYAFLNPTLEDNYPTTNLEAISCGTPVITFDTGGSPESAGYYGIVCERSVEGLLKAIEGVPKIRTDSLEEAREAFDSVLMKQRYLALYREMMAK